MHTYDSDAFIASVLNNLPSPQDSGPQSRRGKEIVAANAVTHGLRLREGKLLPCKRKCYYKDICEWHEMIYSDSKDMYAGPCPYELALLMGIEDKLNEQYSEASIELRREYIELTIAINRCNRFISIHPDIRGSFHGLSYVHVVKDLHLKKWMKCAEELRKYDDEPLL